MARTGREPFLPATRFAGAHPGDYAVGSPKSRIAALLRAAHLDQVRPRMHIIFSGLDAEAQPSIGECPHPTQDGTIVAIVHLPVGWAREQWQQFLAQQPRQKQREWEAFFEDDKMQPAPLTSAAQGGPS